MLEEIRQKNKFGTIEVVVLVTLTCFFSVVIGVLLGGKYFTNNAKYEKVPKDIEKIVDNYNYIIDNFYGEIEPEKIVEGAVKGMVESLGDKYTSFIDETQNERFNIELKGSFEGLGIEIINDIEENIVIINVFDDSPASKAGLKVMDKIVKVDDMLLAGKTTSEFTNIIKNKKSEFKLTVDREGKNVEIIVKKGIVNIQSVNSKIYNKNDNQIGYINIGIFAENTYNQFKRELKMLEESKIDSLIIDLRYNTGGHLSVVDNTISLFLDASHIIYQTKTKENIEKFYSSGHITKTYPIVLISNGESASASEVMIAALRDEYGAKVVGEVTYGKGTVQVLNDVSLNTQYKITTKRWLTPKGKEIEGVGITPDYKIEQDNDYYIDFDENKDSQLQQALKVISEI